MAQKTVVIDYNGQKVVSNPFTFKHACIIDDLIHKEEGKVDAVKFREFAHEALKKMFEGTVVTDEILDTEINMKELRNICDRITEWFLGIEAEVKNS